MREEREKLCNLCYSCKFDCVHLLHEPIDKCVNYEKGLTRKEYLAFIREYNINVKKICNKNNLSLNIMYKMLSGKMHFLFKYRCALDSRIFENIDYKYIARFDDGEK